MAEANDRIVKLEKEVKALVDTVRPGKTPALAIAFVLLLVIYLVAVFKMPMPGDPDFWMRAAIAFGSAFAGGGICVMALGFVEAAFKVLVEVAMALLIFGNVMTGMLVWINADYLRDYIIELDGVPNDKAFIAGLVAAAIALFIADVLAFLVLYPLAKTAGTKLKG